MLTYKNVRLAHALLSTAAIVGYFVYGEVFLFAVLALVMIYIALVMYGVFHVHADFFLPLYNESSISHPTIALTFDDGPSNNTEEVLDVLKKYNIKATFFLIGSKINAGEPTLLRMLEEGHELGNHTYSHSKTMGFYPAVTWNEELEATRTEVKRITGVNMKLFRPPFGVTTPQVAKSVADLNLHAIGWSVRSFDTTSRSIKHITNRVLNQVKPGAVVLLHDDREKCPQVLEALIPQLLEQNYSFTTVSDLFQIEAYENN